jgi:HEAT repeat protein
MADTQKLLADLQSKDKDVRFAAWRAADRSNADAIPQLGKLAASSEPGIAKAARESLITMTHSVGRDTSGRSPVVSGLLKLTSTENPVAVRTLAFRLLSQIAGEDSIPAIMKFIAAPDVREEAIYAVERIPGAAANKALIGGYKDAKDDFKPRILFALGHRRAEDAAALCTEAMRSANKDISVAASRAFGRIGKKLVTAPKYPDSGLSFAQTVDVNDAQLRYADAQAKQGAGSEALRVYKTFLDRPEEHLQCAAIIGIAKIGTPEAAATIYPKLSSTDRKVRITAANVWKSMAKG